MSYDYKEYSFRPSPILTYFGPYATDHKMKSPSIRDGW
jgi:hypothetical protein